MSYWKSVLKGDPIGWLLESTNPSVRYFTLTELLEKPETEPEVIKAKNEIMDFGVIPKILSKQNAQGYWDIPDRLYTAKLQRDCMAAYYLGGIRS